MAEATRKRKYVTRQKLIEALDREQIEHPNRSPLNRSPKPKKAKDIPHPALTGLVTVEMRTGSGVVVRVVSRGRAFRHVPSTIGQGHSCCRPAIHHCLDRFYGEIDRRIRDWEFQRDLALRVPYAVKRHRKEKAHERQHYKRLRDDAVRRGLV